MIMIIVTMTIKKKRPFGIGSWMDLDIGYAVCTACV